MSIAQHPQLLLKLPQSVAKLVNSVLEDDDKGSKAFNISVKAESILKPDDYLFEFNDEEYPALLGNNPTFIETHKTFDNKVLYKAGDIGQILYVFETESEREEMRKLNSKSDNDYYFRNGLTPPTQNIVKKRFEKTRRSKKQPTSKIVRVIDEISKRWSNIVTNDGKTTDRKEYTEIIEEVVDYEDWMLDSGTGSGKTIEISPDDFYNTNSISESLNYLLQHPTLLMRQSDIELEKESEEKELIEIARSQEIQDITVVSTEPISSIVDSKNITMQETETKIETEPDDSSMSDESDDSNFDLEAHLEARKISVNEDISDVKGNNEVDLIGNEQNMSHPLNIVVTNPVTDDHVSEEGEDDDDWMNIETDI